MTFFLISFRQNHNAFPRPAFSSFFPKDHTAHPRPFLIFVPQGSHSISQTVSNFSREKITPSKRSQCVSAIPFHHSSNRVFYFLCPSMDSSNQETKLCEKPIHSSIFVPTTCYKIAPTVSLPSASMHSWINRFKAYSDIPSPHMLQDCHDCVFQKCFHAYFNYLFLCIFRHSFPSIKVNQRRVSNLFPRILKLFVPKHTRKILPFN